MQRGKKRNDGVLPPPHLLSCWTRDLITQVPSTHPDLFFDFSKCMSFSLDILKTRLNSFDKFEKDKII